MMRKEPPFPNDSNYIKEIEAKIRPNRQFPFVQLKSLVEENRRHLAASLTSKDKKRESTTAEQKSDGLKSDFKCHLCFKEFAYQVKLTFHLKNNHPEVEKPFACSLCQDSYKTSRELKLHLVAQHPDEFKLRRTGNQIFASTKKHQCPHCSKKFTCTVYLNIHINSHTKERAYVCDVCGSKYLQASGLQKHKRLEKCSQAIELNLSRKFQCDHCEVAVASKKNLTKHMRILHGILIEPKKKLDFNCLFCDYKAPNSTVLQGHNRVHTEEKPFECKACSKAFTFKSNLDAHIRSHCPAAKVIGLEPDVQQKSPDEADVCDAQGRFKCSICDLTFGRRSSRNVHEEIHGDKFMCQFCPAGFKHKVGLKLHEIKMHPKQMITFKCTSCEIAFFSLVGLQKHKLECSGQKSTKEQKRNQEEETKDKKEGQGSADTAIIAAEQLPEASSSYLVNATLSWVQSVTNNTSDQLSLEYYESGVIPITVLKMEH